MSQTTINFTFAGDDLTQLSSVVLSDPTATFGVRRNDTNATVVASGTAMVQDSPGVYHYTFTDPAPGLIYTIWVTVVYRGATLRQQLIKPFLYGGTPPVPGDVKQVIGTGKVVVKRTLRRAVTSP